MIIPVNPFSIIGFNISLNFILASKKTPIITPNINHNARIKYSCIRGSELVLYSFALVEAVTTVIIMLQRNALMLMRYG